MDPDPFHARTVELERRLKITTAALVKIIKCTGLGTVENREARQALADVGYDVTHIEE